MEETWLLAASAAICRMASAAAVKKLAPQVADGALLAAVCGLSWTTAGGIEDDAYLSSSSS